MPTEKIAFSVLAGRHIVELIVRRTQELRLSLQRLLGLGVFFEIRDVN
jgi:hypothetical protein